MSDDLYDEDDIKRIKKEQERGGYPLFWSQPDDYSPPYHGPDEHPYGTTVTRYRDDETGEVQVVYRATPPNEWQAVTGVWHTIPAHTRILYTLHGIHPGGESVTGCARTLALVFFVASLLGFVILLAAIIL